MPNANSTILNKDSNLLIVCWINFKLFSVLNQTKLSLKVLQTFAMTIQEFEKIESYICNVCKTIIINHEFSLSIKKMFTSVISLRVKTDPPEVG